MKILKWVLMVLVAIIALLLIVAAFVDKEYVVIRDITINQPDSLVFDYLKYLKNQDNFTTWSKMDPNVEKSFRGTDGTVGAVAGWKSENPDVGSGEQEIIKIEEGKRIDYELRFFEPWESKGYAYFEIESVVENQTKVEWGFEGKMDYPWNLMMLFMDMEKMLGPSLEEGLQNLKNLLETSAVEEPAGQPAE
ncbi:MAG: hypothetical protein Kow0037_32060 [Calditrichia bacterium]